jgi:DNA polymerase-3 subunit epsilon
MHLPAQRVLASGEFAVIDLETTGLSPGWRDRIVEVAVVVLDANGLPVGDWSTLVNPCRDVGPTSLHGLRPRDLVDAPTFGDIAGELAGLLAGRVVVAHNLAFDLRFLRAEYGELGCPDVPLNYEAGLCTMRLALHYLPYAPRALGDCCAAAGWKHRGGHAALADAHAAARLLRHYLARVDGTEAWLDLVERAAGTGWPKRAFTAPDRSATPTPKIPLPREAVAAERLAAAVTGAGDRHFLARLVPALPRVPEPPMADAYLGVLDDALADRKVDAGEADALVELAADLGLDRPTTTTLHLDYLRSLARAAWEDDVIEPHEREDLAEVAALLGLTDSDVDQALETARTFTGRTDTPSGTLRLAPGDRVCFTGQMSRPRSELAELAAHAGLDVATGVSKKTTVLVCADADSMSGKARKARDLAVTVISEPKFHQLLRAIPAAADMPGSMPVTATWSPHDLHR